MISSDRISEDGQGVSVFNGLKLRELFLNPLEERRVVYVS